MPEPDPSLQAEDVRSDPPIDPDMEKEARHSDMPDGSAYKTVYNNSDNSQSERGNQFLLVIVLCAVGTMVGILVVLAWK
jgi:hypothetical protein